MTVAARRKPILKGAPKRRPLNLRGLEMMVQSGVVRRADFDPPSFGNGTRLSVLDEVDHASVTEMVTAQGWLARLLLGRRS
jgi:hypothetical protein